MRSRQLVLCFLAAFVSIAAKPAPETLLKPKSLARINEDNDIITNSEWTDGDDFAFVNGGLIRAPMKYARPIMTDFTVYPKMSSAISKMNFDPKTQVLEVEGRYQSLYMHSWVLVDQKLEDEIHFTFIKGDMRGLKSDVYLWDKEGKTLVIAKGFLPKGRKMFSGVVALLFKPASEIVIGVATKNFRSYIEEEYQKKKKTK